MTFERSSKAFSRLLFANTRTFFVFFLSFFAQKNLRHMFFGQKICFGQKKIFSPKYENKTTKLGVENRAQHASQRHLSVLKTDSNLASKCPAAGNDAALLCACVFPGGPPEGILDRAEHVVSRVVFLLFLFWTENIFFYSWLLQGAKR